MKKMKREELLSSAESFGWNTLSNEELISIALNIAEDDIEKLNEYFQYNIPSISGVINLGIEGINQNKAEELIALHSFFTRTKQVKRNTEIKRSEDLFNAIRPSFDNASTEEVWLMLIDNGCHVVKKIRLSSGTFDCSVIDVRMIIKKCLENNIVTFAIAHNHLGESLTPSQQDVKSTHEIYRASQLMRMRFLDHIIVANDTYFSFSDKEMLE